MIPVKISNLLLEPKPDFIQFWEAGRMCLLRLNPYERLLTSPGPFNYPPAILPFLSFFGILPQNLAAIIWNFASIFSLVLTIYLLVKIVKWQLAWWQWLLIYGVTFWSFPVKFTLGMGQVNHFVLLFLVFGLYYLLLPRVRPSVGTDPNLALYRAGFFFSLAGSIKLSPFIFGLYFLGKKEWQALKWLIIGTLFLFLLPFLIIPWSFQRIYYADIFFRAFSAVGKEVYYNQSLTGFISRQLSYLSFQQQQALIVFLSLFFVGLSALFLKRDRLTQWSTVLSLMVMLNALSWQHHLVFLIPCFFFLRGDKTNKTNRTNWWRRGLLFVAYLLLAINFKNPQEVAAIWGAWILSHGFYGTFLLWWLSLT